MLEKDKTSSKCRASRGQHFVTRENVRVHEATLKVSHCTNWPLYALFKFVLIFVFV